MRMTHDGFANIVDVAGYLQEPTLDIKAVAETSYVFDEPRLEIRKRNGERMIRAMRKRKTEGPRPQDTFPAVKEETEVNVETEVKLTPRRPEEDPTAEQIEAAMFHNSIIGFSKRRRHAFRGARASLWDL